MGDQLASIIVITRNRLGYTKLTLDSIFKKTVYYPYELIVVDNNSTDGTIDYLKDLENRGMIDKLILLDKNYGAGYAMNQGIKVASGKYYIRSDNDMVYNLGWLTALIKALVKIPHSLLQVAVFGQLVEDGTRAEFSVTNEIDGIIIREIDIGGCNMAFTREVYQKLGPFPHLMCTEDGIYCTRARQKGYIVGQIDDGTATHIDHPGCCLSMRYTKYAESRMEVLENQRRAGVEFLSQGDKDFYKKYKEKK